MHFKTLFFFFFFKSNFEISYFNSPRMRLPSQLPGPTLQLRAASFVPPAEAKEPPASSARPQHPRPAPPARCRRQDQALGEGTELISLPQAARRGFGARSRANGFGTHFCPHPFRMGMALPAPVSPRRVLSDSRREKGRENHTSAARLALEKLDGRGFSALLSDRRLLARAPPLFRIYITRTRLRATTKL